MTGIAIERMRSIRCSLSKVDAAPLRACWNLLSRLGVLSDAFYCIYQPPLSPIAELDRFSEDPKTLQPLLQ